MRVLNKRVDETNHRKTGALEFLFKCGQSGPFLSYFLYLVHCAIKEEGMALVQIAEHPFEFFLEALARALKAERVQVTPDAHIYVARLLLQTMTDGRHPS